MPDLFSTPDVDYPDETGWAIEAFSCQIRGMSHAGQIKQGVCQRRKWLWMGLVAEKGWTLGSGRMGIFHPDLLNLFAL